MAEESGSFSQGGLANIDVGAVRRSSSASAQKATGVAVQSLLLTDGPGCGVSNLHLLVLHGLQRRTISSSVHADLIVQTINQNDATHVCAR